MQHSERRYDNYYAFLLDQDVSFRKNTSNEYEIILKCLEVFSKLFSGFLFYKILHAHALPIMIFKYHFYYAAQMFKIM